MLKVTKKSATRLETITLTNDDGMSVEIINFGARIKSIKYPVNDTPTEMILGYDEVAGYLHDDSYLGATCGRVCNRIAGAAFMLNGTPYKLAKNDGENCLHGGDDNFSFRFWQVHQPSVTKHSVTLSLVSVHGDQGFPGTVTLSVTYQLSQSNTLSIQYLATTDAATPINLTNHAYFNLGEPSCESLALQLNASSILESRADGIPTGKVVDVSGTDYDFNQATNIGERQQHTQDQSLKEKQGYDHCFVLNHSPAKAPKAVLTSVNNKVSLSVYTDQPAIQLYTGFYLSGKFSSYQGLCLEAQNYTDADNNPHFPSNILQANQQYQRHISYAFSSLT